MGLLRPKLALVVLSTQIAQKISEMYESSIAPERQQVPLPMEHRREWL